MHVLFILSVGCCSIMVLGLLILNICSLQIWSHLKLHKVSQMSRVCALRSTKSVSFVGWTAQFSSNVSLKAQVTSNHIDSVFKWSHMFVYVVSVGLKSACSLSAVAVVWRRQSNMWITLWSEIFCQSKQVRGWNKNIKKTSLFVDPSAFVLDVNRIKCLSSQKNSNFQ